MLIVIELAITISYSRIVITAMPKMCRSGSGMEMIIIIMQVKIMLLLLILILVLLRVNSALKMDS